MLEPDAIGKNFYQQLGQNPEAFTALKMHRHREKRWGLGCLSLKQTDALNQNG